MSSAGSIASHGKVNKVSALSIISFGRLERVRAIIELLRVEIMRISSMISRILRGTSEI